MTTSQNPRHVPKLVCPQCECTFSVNDVRGNWLDRLCPECGGSLSAATYDRYASKKRKVFAQIKTKIDEQKDLALRHGKIADLITNPHLGIVRTVLRRNAARHRRNLERLAEDINAPARDINAAALSRYYTSEWYLCSGVALKDDGSDHPYELRATYDDNAVFHLDATSGGAVAGGVLGEQIVFEKLCSLVRSGELPSDCRLVPNFFLTSARNADDGLLDQVDLVVLARTAAVVCEIKRWRSHVCVSQEVGGLQIGTFADRACTTSDDRGGDKPLRQVERGMEDLAALGVYPKDRIFGLVVFVNPKSLTLPDDEASGPVRVASCSLWGDDTLAQVVKPLINLPGEALEREELDSVAGMMLNELVDRDGALARRQYDLWQASMEKKRHARLSLLADASVERRQERYQKKKARGKRHMDDNNVSGKKTSKGKRERKERHARKQRYYDLSTDIDDWGY